MLEEFKSIDPDNLPTYHNLTKTRPKIEALLFEKLETLDEPQPPQDPNSTTDTSNSTRVPLCLPIVDDEDSAAIVGGQRKDKK